MAVVPVTSVSNLTYGDRSVAFTTSIPFNPGDYGTLAFSVIVDALTAAGVKSSAIKTFLSTTHVDSEGTVRALAQNGLIVSCISQDADNVTFFADNSMSVGIGVSAIRFSLATSINA